MADNNSPIEEKKFSHVIEHLPEEKESWVNVEVKILGKGPSPLEFSFSISVEEFIWQDDDSAGKIALEEFFTDDAEIDINEVPFLIVDMISYVCKNLGPVDEDFKGIFNLMVEFKLKPVMP
ncbi:hypothetical protein V5N11_034037 [Cardamine amara subsp. amara]|uniref:Uncharacterized protein n=1 Tax=Cardamine amara subsp. amara TaxID=228776 RepID=A0ABD0Z9R6_CARAN